MIVIKIRPVIKNSEKLNKVQIIKTEDSSNFINFRILEDTKTYVKQLNSNQHQIQPIPENVLIPEKDDPQDYLKDIFIEPGVMNTEQYEKLQNLRYWICLEIFLNQAGVQIGQQASCLYR